MAKFAFLFGLLLLILVGCGGTGSTGATTQITLSPATASVQPLSQQQFTVDQNALVDWSAPDGGTVVNGLFTAPGETGTYRVVATSILNPLNFATALANVSDIAVSVTPTFISVAPSSVTTNAFTAVVAGSSNTAVTWTVGAGAAGSIAGGTADGNGNARATFTAGTTPGLYTIFATSAADNTVVGSAQVQVLGSSSLGLNPRSVTLSATAPNNTVTLTAVLTDSSGVADTTTPLIWDVPLDPVGGTLAGTDLRVRTFTVPTTFVGQATCQVRVRTSPGIAQTTTIQVVAN